MPNLGSVPSLLACRDPELAALRCGGRTLTARQLDRASAAVAAALERRGIGGRATVALLCGNGLAFPVAFYGALRSGAMVAPLSTASAAIEIRTALRTLRAEAVLCDAAHADAARRALDEDASGALLLVIDDGIARSRVDRLALATLVDRPAADAPDLPGSAPAVVLGTSGTTGLPRLAVHTHAGLVLNARAVAGEMLGLTPGDRQLGALPLAHSFGLSAVLNASLVAGCGVVLMARFDPTEALQLVADEGVTVVQGVPTMIARLAGERAAAGATGPLPGMRRLVVSGAPLPAGLATAVHRDLCVGVLERWGMTECSPLTMRAVPPDGGDDGDVGRPLRGVCVRVVGEPGEGVPGELEATSPTLFSGYLRDRRATAAAVVDGFLRTGDLGTVDRDGRVRLRGRIKDVVVRGGNNVAALEVERALLTHPAVREAAVLGVPDPGLGEEIAAVVVLDGDQPIDGPALALHCRTLLSAYKVPRLWATATQLPRTSTGKVRKSELRDLFTPH